MRWGEAATPQEIARIERAVRRRGGEGAADIVEILALDGRIQNIWLRLGLGAGALLSAACVGIYLVVSGDPGPGGPTSLAVLTGSTIALFPGVAIGTLVGFSRMKREPHNLDAKPSSPRLWDYCPPIVLIFPCLVLFGNLLLMSLLVLRLAPNLDSDSLARAFALPGMWSVPVAPAILLALVIAMMVVIWRIGALPLLVLPRDADARRHADSIMRKVAILQIVIFFSAVAVEIGLGQLLPYWQRVFYPSYPSIWRGWKAGISSTLV